MSAGDERSFAAHLPELRCQCVDDDVDDCRCGEDDFGEWDCTHCCGEGTCDANANPLWDCDDNPHPCHACGGSGLRRDQRIF